MNPLFATWAMIVLSTLFWGSNFNAGQALADDLPALTAAAERFSIGMFMFLALRCWQGKAESHLRLRDLLVLAPFGLLGVAGFNYAFFVALHTTSALNAALIMALSPLVSVLLSALLLKTRITAAQLVGMALAFAGVSLVITDGHFGQLHVAVGDLWMLFGCLAWSLYSVGSKRYAPQVPPLQFARWTVGIGSLTLIVAALLLEQPLPQLAKATPSTHTLLLYMGTCGSFLAYIFWLKGVHALGPDKAAIAFNLVPVFTLLVNLLLGKLPDAVQVAGLVIVLGGVLIFNGWRPLPAWRKQPV